MSEHGYIKYPRELHNNPIFKSFSLEYRHIFLTILMNMSFCKREMNDRGVLFEIQPGQFLTTVRGLADLCDCENINASMVQRALKRFSEVNFSIQKTIHTKTLITIVESSVCETLKNDSDTRIDTTSIQDRYTNKNGKNVKKKNISPSLSPSFSEKVIPLNEETIKESQAIFFNRETQKFENITEEQMKSWKEEFPLVDIAAQLNRMRTWLIEPEPKNQKSKGTRLFIERWLDKDQKKEINNANTRKNYSANGAKTYNSTEPLPKPENPRFAPPPSRYINCNDYE